MQGAHQMVAVDLAEHAEIGLPMGAGPLADVIADADLLAGDTAPVGIGLADGLGFSATHALDRQRLEEVVEVLVERALAPRMEAAREEQRVAPVDRPGRRHGLDQLALDVEAVAVGLAVVGAYLPCREVDEHLQIAEPHQAVRPHVAAQRRRQRQQRFPPRPQRVEQIGGG